MDAFFSEPLGQIGLSQDWVGKHGSCFCFVFLATPFEGWVYSKNNEQDIDPIAVLR